MNNTTLGERMKELRTKNGYSQEMIASLIGVSRQSVSHYESNRRIPSLYSLLTLSELYKVHVDTFINLMPTNENSANILRENNFIIGLSEDSLNYTNITSLEYHLLQCFRAMTDSERDELISIAEKKFK